MYRIPKWNFRNAKWQLYRETSDRLLGAIPQDLPVEEYCKTVTDTILTAAYQEAVENGTNPSGPPILN